MKLSRNHKLSIVIPILNEEDIIPRVIAGIQATMSKLPAMKYEVIVVDDGSTDNSVEAVGRLQDVAMVKMAKHSGQSAALKNGIVQSTGDIIVTMDGDGQNNPADIPRLLKKLDEGYDMVCGIRKHRKDLTTRIVASLVWRYLRRVVLNDTVQDAGCGLKVIKRTCFDNFDFPRNFHRFLPWLLKRSGYRVTEILVDHRHRQFGVSRYSMARYAHGLLDLLYFRLFYR